MALTLESSAFKDGAPIPQKHTCDGEDLSPELSWSGAPKGTAALALICDDPDAPAGTWVHWVLYDVAPNEKGTLPAALQKEPELKEPRGGRQGKNDFGRIGYGGPCPPRGKAHRYFFKLYALDRELALPPGKSKAEIEQAMKGHVLAEAKLMGTYQRK